MGKIQWLNIHVLAVAVAVTLVSIISASDFRGFDFSDEDTDVFGDFANEKSFHHESYFPSDFNLGALDLVDEMPNFAKLASYVNPDGVKVVRNKRKTATSHEESSSSSEDDDEDEKSKSGEGPDDYVDRYERFVSHHFKNRDEQRQNDDAKGDEDNYSYRFDFSPSDDYERIKQESEAQSRQLAKTPKNCKAYEQDGMLCQACRDPATDTVSESCAYATVPHHNKFAYVKQKNYNSKDHEKQAEKEEEDSDEEQRDDDQDDQEDAEEDTIEETTKRPLPVKHQSKAEKVSNLPQNRKVIPTKKSVVHVKPGQQATNGGGYRYSTVDMRSNKQRPQPVGTTATIAHQPAHYGYYTHFFPSSYAGASARNQKIQQKDEESKDDVYVLSYRDNDQVAKVLADFESRDWSNCKKGNKNELTCYTCTDKDGVKHEECMYLSESRQISSRANPPQTSTQPTSAVPVPPTTVLSKKLARSKKAQQKSVEKKPISPKLRNQRAKQKESKLEKLQLKEDAPEMEDTSKGSKRLERQTVKRTVSIKSHVDGVVPLGDERVVHYEHHVSHRL